MNYFEQYEDYATYFLIGFFALIVLIKLFSKGNKLLKIEISTAEGNKYYVKEKLLNKKINISKEWLWIVLIYPIRTIYLCQNNPINFQSKGLLLSLLKEFSTKDWNTYDDIEEIVGKGILCSKDRGGKKIILTLVKSSSTIRDLYAKNPFQRFETQYADTYVAILLTAVCRMNDSDKIKCKNALKYLWGKYEHLDTNDPKNLYLPNEAFKASRKI